VLPVPEGYANPELLVETDWLAEHLDDPNLRVVDADLPPAYGRAHIPGAVGHVSDNVYLKIKSGETFLMGPEQFAETMSRMGIGDDTLVVSYDGNMSLHAARFWWALTHYGYRKGRVLNGGIHKWIAEGRPVTTAQPRVDASAYTFTTHVDDSVLATCDLVQAAVGRGDTVLLDVRSEGEWTGANDRGNKRRGHAPGAVHLEWTNFVTADETRVFKPAAELREMLRAKGITPDKNVFTY
jgi:thiosulfate/3-mercaptopyruvate sulfurtransferase